jgi:glutamate formiminotransferase / 5-formyltetrahydrofolate cyclo-ligase
MLECVMNVSEGRDGTVLERFDSAIRGDLLDRHTDADHHRSVFTLVGTDAPRRLASLAVAELDVRSHTGVHPRLGVVDVVPFVPLAGATLAGAVRARDEFAAWAAGELGVPCFLYGPQRTLPEIRRHAFRTFGPDVGPREPHVTAGAMCVGARDPLVAYNVWLADGDLTVARRIASEIRSPELRALGLGAGDGVQVSMNLVAPERLGPAAAYDLVAARALVGRAELVGLIPQTVLQAVPRDRWAGLDLDADRTIEARLQRVR